MKIRMIKKGEKEKTTFEKNICFIDFKIKEDIFNSHIKITLLTKEKTTG